VRLLGQMSPSEFSKRFTTLFEHSTFRLETLDFYIAANEQEPFARFLSGQPQDLTWREPWRRLVTRAVADGKFMQRVHVVSEPLTPYIEFELTCAYPTNEAAGEEIRILPRRESIPLGLPSHDYWLFDSRLVGLMEYDEDGGFLGIDFLEDPETVHRHCRWKDIALQNSQPLRTYLANAGLRGQVGAAPSQPPIP
jgi:hypothetical protein